MFYFCIYYVQVRLSWQILNSRFGSYSCQIYKARTLMPPPKLNLTRFHGVFAPYHSLRRQITQAKPRKALSQTQHQYKTASYKLTWAARLKRVFHIDIERCEHCGGKVSIIATIATFFLTDIPPPRQHIVYSAKDAA